MSVPARFRATAVLLALTTVAACSGGDDDARSVAEVGGASVDDVTSDEVADTGPDSDADPDSGATPEALADQESWTVLVYMMGDNDLEPYAVDDVIEMAGVETSGEVNLIAMLDRHPAYELDDDPLGDFEGIEVYRSSEGSELAADGGWSELNLGSAETLAGFIADGLTEYPADHTAVILWNHGAGWPGMGPDETDGNDILDLAEIDQALSEGLSAAGLDRLDLIGFDACLMASYEVAAVMSHHADYMLASAELEPGHGWDYSVLADITADTDPVGLGTMMIDGFVAQAEAEDTDEDITLSMLDLAAVPAMEAALAELAAPLMADPTASAPVLATAQRNALAFGASPDPDLDSFHVDLAGLATAIADEDPSLSGATQGVVEAVDQMVVASTTGRVTADATGLSIYLPPVEDHFDQGYLYLDNVTVWPDLLTSHFTAGAAIGDDEQPAFVDPASGLPSDEAYSEFGPDGLTIGAVFDTVAEGNIVEAVIQYGVLDESDDSLIFIGEEPAFISDDGSGLVEATYDLTVLTISDGVDTDYAYLDLTFDEDEGLLTFDVPLWYVPAGDEVTDDEVIDVVLSLVVDEDGDVISEIYYQVGESGTTGELYAEPEALIYPVLLNEYPDGTAEWITISEVGLWADLPDLEYDLEPLESGTTLFAQLVIWDYGGNTATASILDVIP